MVIFAQLDVSIINFAYTARKNNVTFSHWHVIFKISECRHCDIY